MAARAHLALWSAIAEELAGTLPRPDDLPLAHAPGPTLARVLLVGGGVAMGWGVRSHDLALPGTIARSLALASGRGIDVDLVTTPSMGPRDVVAAVRSAGAQRFDAVVVTVGFDAAMRLQPVAMWRDEVVTMLSELRILLGEHVGIVVAGIPLPRLIGVPGWAGTQVRDNAAQLDETTALCVEASCRAAFVRVGLDVDEKTFMKHAAAGYQAWGTRIGLALAPLLRGSLKQGSNDTNLHEVARQAAVEGLMLDRISSSPRIQQIINLTRRAFGAESAIFTVIDGTSEHHLVRSGGGPTSISRDQSFCHFAIREQAGMVVEDAAKDYRFSANPRVTGLSPVRFYAGFPIESPDGFAVGALCVLDSAPRREADVNMVLLRECALLIQHELWSPNPDNGHQWTEDARVQHGPGADRAWSQYQLSDSE